MIITSSLRFLYIFWGSGLLWHARMSHKQPRKNSFATTSFFLRTCAICYLNENYSIKVHSFIKKVIRKLYVILISNFYCPSMN